MTKEDNKTNKQDDYTEHELVVSAAEFGRDEETGERLVNLHVGTLVVDVDTYQDWISRGDETLKVYTKR